MNQTFKRRLIQFRVLMASFMIFGALLSASPASAADEVGASDITISGTLSNGDTPVVGVSITATGPGNFTQTVKSDDAGSWTIVVPIEDVYKVTLDESSLPEGVRLSPDTKATQEVDLVGMGFAGVGFQFGAGVVVQEQSFFEQLMIRAFSGLNYGLILAMAAIGISLIYATTGLNNFAHGEMVSIGALFTWFFYVVLGLNVVIAGLLSVLVVAASGFAQDQFLWKPLRKRRLGLNQIMIVSIGFSIVLRHILLIFFNGDTKDIIGAGNPVTFGFIETTDVILISMAINTIALLGVAFFLTRTRVGKASRAVADNASLAASTGIDVENIIRIVWIMAAALTGVGGVLYGLQYQATWDMGYNLLLLLFAAVTLGGLGTTVGATVGALIIGLVVEVSPLWIADELKYAIALLILILILIFRPQGVLGKKQRIG